MRREKVYASIMCLLVLSVVISSARVHLTTDAVSEEIDGHLYGECRSKSPGIAIQYCSFCRAFSSRPLDGLFWDSEDLSDNSGSAGFPFWEDTQ
jgi:hypothetical protein